MAGRPCRQLVTGIDAIRFCPYPDAPSRTVDCYSYGRRSDSTHRALLDMARQRDFFYIHDTANAFSVIDATEHRALLANIAKRSRYLIAYTHNANPAALAITGGEECIGPRFFEGTAAGSVLLGVAPNCPEFQEELGWSDALIPIPFEARNIEEILKALDAQPDRLQRARVNNVLGALEKNDWAHRWRDLLGVVGLKPCDGLGRRLLRLRALADHARADLPVSAPRSEGWRPEPQA